VEHGTPVGWRHHRCRCDACHAALLDEARVVWAVRQVRRGRDPATRVPVGHARRRVAQLEAAGLTRGAIAARAGVSAGTISRLVKPDTTRASRITVAAIMNLSPP
jgi:hypothetical protein